MPTGSTRTDELVCSFLAAISRSPSSASGTFSREREKDKLPPRHPPAAGERRRAAKPRGRTGCERLSADARAGKPLSFALCLRESPCSRTPLAAFVTLLVFASAPARAITIEQAMADPDWIGSPVQHPYWSVDGRSLYYHAEAQRLAGSRSASHRHRRRQGHDRRSAGDDQRRRRRCGVRSPARARRVRAQRRCLHPRCRQRPPDAGHAHAAAGKLAAVFRRRPRAAVSQRQRLVRLRHRRRRRRTRCDPQGRKGSGREKARRSRRAAAQVFLDAARDQGTITTRRRRTTRNSPRPIPAARRSRSTSATT